GVRFRGGGGGKEAPPAKHPEEGKAAEEAEGARRGGQGGGGGSRSGRARRDLMGGRVLVAQIGAAHGLRGEVRLWSFTEDPMAVKDFAVESEDGRAFTLQAFPPPHNF